MFTVSRAVTSRGLTFIAATPRIAGQQIEEGVMRFCRPNGTGVSSSARKTSHATSGCVEIRDRKTGPESRRHGPRKGPSRGPITGVRAGGRRHPTRVAIMEAACKQVSATKGPPSVNAGRATDESRSSDVVTTVETA